MPITTTGTANDIINRVAAEVGLEPPGDAYGSSDPAILQMRYLLNTVGEELVQGYNWGLLTKSYSFTTQDGDTGDYPLPDDFSRMINQTHWDRTNRLPLGGPLSAQDWTYLKGAYESEDTVYASFRLAEGLFKLYPQPPTPDLDINYEYISKNWVQPQETGSSTADEVTQGNDEVLYDKTLASRYLKVKFLEAKGFDSSKAQADFNQTFSFLTGTDKGAKVLNAGGVGNGFPYLDMYRNAPDSGYGR